MADIELVIKIPEEKYKWVKENNPKADKNSFIGIIVHGTPLPKGHGRLIDADAVLEEPIGNTYKDIDIAETIVEADKAESESKK